MVGAFVLYALFGGFPAAAAGASVPASVPAEGYHMLYAAEPVTTTNLMLVGIVVALLVTVIIGFLIFSIAWRLRESLSKKTHDEGTETRHDIARIYDKAFETMKKVEEFRDLLNMITPLTWEKGTKGDVADKR